MEPEIVMPIEAEDSDHDEELTFADLTAGDSGSDIIVIVIVIKLPNVWNPNVLFYFPIFYLHPIISFITEM